MAINFINIKAITIPEGNVDKITNGGAPLWKKIIIIENIPSQSNSLTYTGSTLTPTWSNYDSTQLTIGGTVNSINAGTYMATFTPKSGYSWADGTITAKSVSWSIGKAASSLKLYTDSSHTVEKTNKYIKKTDTRFSVLYIQAIGDGLMQAESNNTSLVTIGEITNTTLSYRVVTLPAKETTIRITISIAEGTNYMASSCYIDIICEND